MERITSRKNPVAVHMRKLASNRSYRSHCNEFLCDGIKLLEEAISSDISISLILTSTGVPFPLSVDTRVYYTDRSLIDSISPLANAQDTLFVCKIPNNEETFDECGTHILLDSVQDPGNVGTIMRTANAFGLKSMILTGACADPYNPKTIRASMGAIFKQRFFTMNTDELSKLRKGGKRFIGAALLENSISISDVSLKDSIIVIGSEGSGLSAEILELCDQTVIIPIEPECDSLNAAVAAGIIMWETTRN